MVAMIFILFDLEVAFLYPWAVVYRSLSWYGLWVMMVFLGLLTVGELPGATPAGDSDGGAS